MRYMTKLAMIGLCLTLALTTSNTVSAAITACVGQSVRLSWSSSNATACPIQSSGSTPQCEFVATPNQSEFKTVDTSTMIAGNSCQVTLGCRAQADGSTVQDSDTLTIIPGNWNGSGCVVCPSGRAWSSAENSGTMVFVG